MPSIEVKATRGIASGVETYNRAELENMFLPIGQMLQLDRVLRIDGDRAVGEMDLLRHWVFPLHFPADPIFPGSLLIEASGQTVAAWAWHMGLRGKPRLAKVSARFDHPVLPTHPVAEFRAIVHRRKFICSGKVDVFAGGTQVGELELLVIVLPSKP